MDAPGVSVPAPVPAPDRAPVVDAETVARYQAAGWWGTETIGAVVRRRAATDGDAPAFLTADGSCSWAQYDAASDAIAVALDAAGVAPGQKVGVLLPDGGAVHAAFVGTARAGATSVGIGIRAGRREAAYLLAASNAQVLVTAPEWRGVTADTLRQELRAAGAPVEHVVTVEEAWAGGTVRLEGAPLAGTETGQAQRTAAERIAEERALGPNDLFLVNSTSGTTGLPKRVRQFENRWHYYHQLVVDAVDLGPTDVFMSVIPAPFGFGLWTAHFTPALAGIPVVLMPRFRAGDALELVQRYGVTVLACVSTQFVMMLGEPRLDQVDLTSLRAIFTGGEAVPFHRAAQFEERTGAKVLQFYGSNETGAYSRTTLRDSREDRLGTCGHVIEEMQPRLYQGDVDITASGGPGQPACRGPATCAGYEDDPEGNRALYTPDGWMRMEDIVTIDERGYAKVTGRQGDFVIRGGKNISAVAVEDAVGTHPSVALVAAVGVPDATFGERVGAFVVLHEDHQLVLHDLVAHLDRQGFSKEMFPEHLFVVDDLPRASGGKVAKGLLRAQVAGTQGQG